MNTITASIPETAMTPPHVLVMEGNTAIAEHIGWMLNHEGFDIDIATTNKRARQALQQKRFDMLVADLYLLDDNGVNTLNRIREDKPETKIIIFSKADTTNHTETILNRGIHDFKEKRLVNDPAKAVADTFLPDPEKPTRLSVVKPIPQATEGTDQRRIIDQVLKRTLIDRDFWIDLLENGSNALSAYRLSGEAKAAIASGDLQWVKNNIGNFPEKQLAFLYKRLEREAW